jgi:site-specific DNA recombinase
MSRRQSSNVPSVPQAVIYCRVSSSQQEDNSSLQTQEERCRAYAAEKGWSVYAVYREVHSGAELFERPQLTRLRESMRQHEFDVLLVYALDRLSRKQTHQGLILSEAEHAGVQWDSVTEDIDDSPQGQILRAIIGGMAEMERLKIAERTIRGRMARAQSGKLLPGKAALFGYQWRDETKGAYDVDPVTGPVVQRIFRDVISGTTLRRLASTLTSEGVPTPAGAGSWSHSTIYGILTRRAYTGEAIAWRYGTQKLLGGRSRVYVRPEEEHARLPEGTIPVLVEEAEFEAVQARLARNREAAARNNGAPERTLLRGGYARCGYCGTALQVVRKGNLVYYRHSNRCRDQYQCPPISIKADRLDTEVWQRVEGVLIQPEIIAVEVARLQDADVTSADLAAIDRQLEALSRKQTNLVKRLALLDDDELGAAVTVELNALAKERKQLHADRADIEARRTNWQTTRDQLDSLEEWCRRVATNLNSLDYDSKRQILDMLGVSARLYHSDHSPRYEISASVPLDGSILSTASSASSASACSSAAHRDGHP